MVTVNVSDKVRNVLPPILRLAMFWLILKYISQMLTVLYKKMANIKISISLN